jgi:GGDEF domain-containing protein
VHRTRDLLAEVDAGLSVGVAVRAEGETMQQCMVRADRCLYEAKADRPAASR